MSAVKARRRFQSTTDKVLDRNDHVWFRFASGHKCCLCGAVVSGDPPAYPTPPDFVPRAFVLPLSDAERAMCPFECGTRMEGP
jgi:hypothetical protein